jgi:hypothetical protein
MGRRISDVQATTPATSLCSIDCLYYSYGYIHVSLNFGMLPCSSDLPLPFRLRWEARGRLIIVIGSTPGILATWHIEHLNKKLSLKINYRT